MKTLGARELTVVDVDARRARELARRLGARAARDLGPLLADADGLVHATPMGMAAYPGTAVPPELLRRNLWVAEVVYMPLETRLLRDARARGCRTLSGAAMVALQAAGSMELFAGLRPDRERMLAHVEALTADARQAA
jgi:shikimate dehydrogenase